MHLTPALMFVVAIGCHTPPAQDAVAAPVVRLDSSVSGYHVASTDDVKGPFTNRLVDETSPYLKQHQHNPVDWYPWGDAAFVEAKRRGVPVFLSIGYAACHWCHVMEEESFEDPILAAYLNENFVAIKVDREERPDVDGVYMDALYKMKGNGGWPASLFLNHKRQPFFGGTYFPKESRLNRPGFRVLLERIHEKWHNANALLQQDAANLETQLRRDAVIGPVSEIDWDAPTAGAIGFQRGWDAENKGWGERKFPMLSRVELLLSYGMAHDHKRSLAMVRELLDAMDAGGIHDHLGGGFHRYTVDPAWRVPHFEKMTYDNGQFLRIYAEAAISLDKPRYRDVTTDIATYLLRDMRHEGGAFYSSEDADSDGEEGTYYVWTAAQIRHVVGAADAKTFSKAYAITPSGNFEKGSTVLSRPEADAANPVLVAARESLRVHRNGRVKPPTDTKRVVAYNGLTISGLARAGRLLNRPEWIDAASKAADACLAARLESGALPRTLEPGSPLGVIDDYAFLAEGLLDLYEATGELRWLVAADDITGEMNRRFWDDIIGGYYFSDAETQGLLIRQKDFSDGARPSGAGRAIAVLARLRSYGAPNANSEMLQKSLLAAGRWLNRGPASVPSILQVVDGIGVGTMEVILAVPAGKKVLAAPFVKAFNASYRPHAVLGWSDDADGESRDRFSALAEKVPDGDAPMAYVCFDGVCKQPTSSVDEMGALMRRR